MDDAPVGFFPLGASSRSESCEGFVVAFRRASRTASLMQNASFLVNEISGPAHVGFNHRGTERSATNWKGLHL
jgi:hypothetical protein